MSCALTSGFTLDCKDAIGGIKSVRLATLADWNTIQPAYDATGADVESFGAAADKFYKYEQLKETSSLTETINSSVSNGTIYYTPEVSIVLSKLASTKRNEIKLLAQNRLVAIIETNDDAENYFVAGVTTGLEVSGGTSTTGTAYADLQGYTITLSGMEAMPMRKLTPSSGTTQAMLDDITH